MNNKNESLTVREYDKIAEDYVEATKRELRKYALLPALIKYFGDLTGKRVIDLGCGTGYSTRLCIDLGAKEVIGIDISNKEIEISKEIDKEDSKYKDKIRYFVKDASEDLSELGRFDVIVAVSLLNYPDSLIKLRKITWNIKLLLKDSGEFISSIPILGNGEDYNSYGIKMFKETIEEGSLIKVTLGDFNDKAYCSFTNYYWSKETYEKVFEEEGFVVRWFDSFVSKEGIEKYGAGFWEEYKNKPLYQIIKASL